LTWGCALPVRSEATVARADAALPPVSGCRHRFLANLGLDNLRWIYDNNHIMIEA
jgi:hypothetical protein